MNMIHIFAVILFVSVFQAVSADQKSTGWDYVKNNLGYLSPEDWYKAYPQCAGKEQSPIRIYQNRTEYDSKLRGVYLNYENSIDGNTDSDNMVWSMHNNGHTLSLALEDGEINTKFQHEDFSFLQMHFHWGHSEHEIAGQHFVSELHLVHQSRSTNDKYAVLGFLFKLSQNDNPALNRLIKRLEDASSEDHKKKYFNYDLSTIIPFKVLNYYRYMGSLTTPNCMEGINWFLAADPVLTISQKQINVLTNLKTHHKTELKFNSRPVQDLHDRVVRRSWSDVFIQTKQHVDQFADKNVSAYSNKLEMNVILIFTALLCIFKF